eukprot:jgi/Botrbrau1/16403/Bobra.0142s0003.1
MCLHRWQPSRAMSRHYRRPINWSPPYMGQRKVHRVLCVIKNRRTSNCTTTTTGPL